MSNVRVYGEGQETLVLVHGLVGNQNVFKRMIEGLTEEYTVVLYDLLGHGVDRGEEVDVSMELFVKQLRDVHKEVCEESVWVAGLSVGSWIVWKYAAQFPSDVKGIMGMGAFESHSGNFIDKKMKWVEEEMKAKEKREWLRLWADVNNPVKNCGMDARGESLFYTLGMEIHEDVLKRIVRMHREEDLSNLSEVKVPFYLIHGEYDHVYRGTIRWERERMNGEDVEEAGHVIPAYQPDELVDVMMDWMDSVKGYSKIKPV